ncbi:immunoglobulin-like domain-containing protein [Paenibacillus sp. HW567]|uniref:immunoglobulin-like domain-containing protein n=1 Tax=Paenibacillus sp. HW567 TaxID=1034769 RepID=UPI001E321D89|nr:immunoglobulin-like domain-containing protein [Paenibacillus sp. HW567]
MFRRKFVASLFSFSILANTLNPAMMIGSTTAYGAGDNGDSQGKWMTGEYHAHTVQSDDAQGKLTDVLDTAFEKNKLDWLALSDHLRMSSRDADGNTLASPIPLSQGIAKYQAPKIKELQDAGKYAGKTIFNGFEWDMPTYDHVGVGIVTDNPGSEDALKAINQFEYLFTNRDASLFNADDVAAWNAKDSRAYTTASDARKAYKWLADNYPDSYALINHPSRKNGTSSELKVSDIRDFNNIAPNIAFGFEGMPGNQMAPDRGETTDVYGGADIRIAKVGGMWDALLGEGRHFWNFANSDFHFKISSDRKYSSGYFPGEYSKNYTWVEGSGMKSIVDGMRSGKSFSVTGDLINALDFRIGGDSSEKEMGGDLEVPAGEELKLNLRFKSPGTNNNGDPVKVDHVDLIAGDVTAKAETGTAAYNKATNDSTKVVKRFTSADWTTDADGYNTISYTIGAADKNQYFRLRGTNIGTDVAGETSGGEPLIDPKNTTSDNETRFTQINNRNYSDMWFYSNPIFVNVTYTDSQAVQEALEHINFPAGKVTSAFSLPSAGAQGASIAWASSNSAVASVTGSNVQITRPALGQPDAKVTLTATATKGAESDTRAFELTVKALGANDPMLHYSFDADQDYGTAVPDVSGNGHNGTLIGGALVTSEHGGAVTLDGSNDAVQVPDGILSGLTSASFTMSVKVDSSLVRPAWLFSFATAPAAVAGTKYFGLLEDGSGRFRTASTTNWYVAEQSVSKGSALTRNVWKSIAYTISGSTGTLYEDGVEVGKNTALSTTPQDIEKTVANYLGRPTYSGDKYFKGKISDFRIYSRTLTTEEITALATEENDGAVADDKAALTLGDTTAVTSNLTLPAAGSNGSTISWQTSNAAVVGTDGTVTRQNDGTKTVTLTATISKGTATAVTTFTVTVLGTGDAEAVDKDSRAINLGTKAVQSDKLTLPASGTNGSTIEWKSSDVAVLEDDGTVHRPDAADNAKVVLTATVTKGSAVTTRTFELVVLSQTPVLAHWKFSQDNVASGALDSSNLRLGDLSGLGNDLTLVTTGNGLSSEAGSMLKWSEDGKSLEFGNYRGASVGKYFKTVDGAPINSEEFMNGYTIEAVFKMPKGFTPARNQWTGLLTRQGTGKQAGKTAGETEILTTLSVSNLGELQWESYPTNLNDNSSAWSFSLSSPNNWYHTAIVNDGKKTKLYIDGVTDFRNTPEDRIGIKAVNGKGWNIGASEWDGAIDGLFAGSLEEIKITANALPESKWVVQDYDTAGLIEGNNDDTPLVSGEGTYTFAFLPDTQMPVRYQENIFFSQMQWLVDNYKKMNIKMTSGLGDIVDQSWVSEQWDRATVGYNMLDSAGVPYIVTRGNHDVGGYDSYTYLNRFGASRFSDKSYWHGGSPSGTSSYVIYEAGSYKYMVLSIDMKDFNTDLAWAKSVLAANSKLPTILISHEILVIGGNGDLEYSGNGQSMFDNLVKDNNQVFMTIAGHNHGTGYRVVKNTSGNDVIEMLVDYQSYYHGGNGWMRLMELDEANNKLIFRTYSPWVDSLSQGELTFFDLKNLTNNSENFTTNFNFDERFSFYNKVGSLAGTVTDGTNPLDGVKVSLTVNGQQYSALTSADGSYKVADIPAGDGYTVTASKAGYVDAELKQLSIRSNGTTEGDMLLKPLSTVFYKVTFDANGGDTAADPAEKAVIEHGNVGVLPAPPTRSGYVFAGWNSKPDGSGAAFNAATEVTGDVTVYAQWTDLLLRYTFDANAANGTAVPDKSGNSNNGLLIGGAEVTASHGGSVKLNGTNGAVQLPNGILKGLSDATFTMNIKVDSSMARPAWLLSFASAPAAVSGTKYLGLLEDSGSKFRASITQNWYPNEQTVSKGSAIDRGVWKSIAFQISGTTGTLYVDGVQVGQNTNMTLTPKDVEATVANYLGRPAYSGDKYFMGEISDFRIYSRALSANEIAAVATEDLTNYGTISGMVTDGTDPLAGAAVEVTVNDQSYRAVTGADGRYVLGSIPAGSGYKVTASLKGYEAGAADNVTVAADAVANADIALKAIVYSVSFDKNGGDTEADPAKVTVAEGKSIGTLPALPTYKDYLFTGWNTAADGSGTAFTAATPVTANLTVYAQWKKVEKTGAISGTITDGSLPMAGAVAQVTVSGSVYSAFTNPSGEYLLTGIPEGKGYTVTASKSGYLDGSAADVSVTANETTQGVNITLGLVVVITKYTVSFDRNGGDTAADPAEVTVDEGKSLHALPTPPTRAGYLFTGWNLAANGSGAAFTAETPVAANLTVYAQWRAVEPGEPEAQTGSISGTVTDGSLPVAGAVVTVSGSVYSAITNTAGGYIIAGVPEGNRYTVTASKAGYQDGSAADITVKAKETTSGVNIKLTQVVVVKKVTVTFNGNGGDTAANPSALTVNEGESLISLPAAPTRSGYSFIGWNTAADGSGKSFTAGMPVSADLTVYAQWQRLSTPAPTPVPTTAPVSTPTPAPTASPSPSPSASPSPTPTATVTPVPTATATPQPSAPALSDITQHWAKTAIQQAVDLGIVKGYPDGSFKPNGEVNRAEFASLLVRAMKQGTSNGELTFADKISTPAWASASIRSAVDAGWIKGFEDNSFRPLQKVTRIEMTVMAVRALGLEVGSPEKLAFADAKDIPAWANAYVAAAVKAGIVKGGTDNRFNPGAAASRAESIVLLMNMLDYNSSK